MTEATCPPHDSSRGGQATRRPQYEGLSATTRTAPPQERCSTRAREAITDRDAGASATAWCPLRRLGSQTSAESADGGPTPITRGGTGPTLPSITARPTSSGPTAPEKEEDGRPIAIEGPGGETIGPALSTRAVACEATTSIGGVTEITPATCTRATAPAPRATIAAPTSRADGRHSTEGPPAGAPTPGVVSTAPSAHLVAAITPTPRTGTPAVSGAVLKKAFRSTAGAATTAATVTETQVTEGSNAVATYEAISARAAVRPKEIARPATAKLASCAATKT